MENPNVSLEGVACPACHMGCRLASYQCGRGKEFYDLAIAGEELPQRRGPMMTPSERAALGGATRPPLNRRVMHTLNVVANVLQKRHEEAGERKLVLTLARVHFMSLPFLTKRMLVSSEEFDEALETARQLGLVIVEEDAQVGTVARLTDAGKRQAAAWQAERDSQTEEFLSPLSEEEREMLESLLRKLMVKP